MERRNVVISGQAVRFRLNRIATFEFSRVSTCLKQYDGSSCQSQTRRYGPTTCARPNDDVFAIRLLWNRRTHLDAFRLYACLMPSRSQSFQVLENCLLVLIGEPGPIRMPGVAVARQAGVE